jgi:hypothetical protein
MSKSNRDNWCKNYNGLARKACDVEINYREVFGGFGSLDCDTIPCLNRDSHILCESATYRTPEEIEAERVEVSQLFGFISQACKSIATQSGYIGVVDCPKCNGKLNWSRASNGHVHGTCQTNECLRWMQ